MLLSATLVPAAHRETRIAQAIKSSLFSKGSTLLLQFLAMPLVARQLGPEKFGLFVLLSSIPNFISALDLGVGPAVGHKIAESVATNDRESEALYFQAALIFVFVVSLAVLALGIGVITSNHYEFFFGSGATENSTLIRKCSWIVTGVVALQMVASLGGKIRAGFQEIHINNLFGTLGNISTVITLLFVAWLKPELTLILFAVYGAGLLFNFYNLGHLVFHRSYLIGAISREKIRPAMAVLVADGGLYALAIGLLGWQREISKVLLGNAVGPVAVGQLGILLSIMSLLGGVVITVTAPVWPAIADARARGEHEWISTLWKKANYLSFGYGLACAAGVAVGGRFFVKLLYGQSYEISSLAYLLVGLYFLTQVLGHLRFTWLMGTNKVAVLAKVSGLEFAANFLGTALLYRFLSVEVLLTLLTFNHFFFSVIIQERWRRRLQDD